MTKKTLLSTLAFALSSLLWAEETEVPSTPHDTFTDSYTTLQDVLMPKTQTWKRSDIASVPKFGGYIIGSYKYGDHDANHGDGFNLRLIRLYVDGTVMKDFKYRLQLEVNGTPHVKDATLEWVHWKFLQVKAGQFKRCFSFENPYNPWNVGVGDYSQIVKKFAGMGDRCGEKTMGGRDMGVQLQGDLFQSRKDGHYQFHYQAAVYNGQGINAKDQNKQKDFIGTLQWSPIRNLTLGAFGWYGKWYSADIKQNLDRKRYAFGVKYEDEKSGWSAVPNMPVPRDARPVTGMLRHSAGRLRVFLRTVETMPMPGMPRWVFPSGVGSSAMPSTMPTVTMPPIPPCTASTALRPTCSPTRTSCCSSSTTTMMTRRPRHLPDTTTSSGPRCM